MNKTIKADRDPNKLLAELNAHRRGWDRSIGEVVGAIPYGQDYGLPDLAAAERLASVGVGYLASCDAPAMPIADEGLVRVHVFKDGLIFDATLNNSSAAHAILLKLRSGFRLGVRVCEVDDGPALHLTRAAGPASWCVCEA